MDKTKEFQEKLQKELEESKPVIEKELEEHPPTIGLIGVSGVGKSFTINRLFKTKLLTSDTVACTKEFTEENISLAFTKGEAKNTSVQLRVIDAPGLGEDISRDPSYLKMYHENLPRCDVILWVMTARNRAVALDQTYLKELSEFHNKIIFGLNQIDLIEPMNWTNYNIPSEKQEKNLRIIIQDRIEKIQDITQSKVNITPYSASKGYDLQELFTALITSAPSNRVWIFESLQGFNYTDFFPKEVIEYAKKRDRKKKLWFSRFN